MRLFSFRIFKEHPAGQVQDLPVPIQQPEKNIPVRYAFFHLLAGRLCEPVCNGACAGGARRDRTADLLRAKQALSQLSYGPFQAMNGSNRHLLAVPCRLTGGSGKS